MLKEGGGKSWREATQVLGSEMEGYLEKGIQTPMARGRSTNHVKDKVDSDQWVVNRNSLSLGCEAAQVLGKSLRGWGVKPLNHLGTKPFRCWGAKRSGGVGSENAHVFGCDSGARPLNQCMNGWEMVGSEAAQPVHGWVRPCMDGCTQARKQAGGERFYFGSLEGKAPCDRTQRGAAGARSGTPLGQCRPSPSSRCPWWHAPPPWGQGTARGRLVDPHAGGAATIYRTPAIAHAQKFLPEWWDP